MEVKRCTDPEHVAVSVGKTDATHSIWDGDAFLSDLCKEFLMAVSNHPLTYVVLAPVAAKILSMIQQRFPTFSQKYQDVWEKVTKRNPAIVEQVAKGDKAAQEELMKANVAEAPELVNSPERTGLIPALKNLMQALNRSK